MNKDQTPALGRVSFRCPHCDAIAHQTWYTLAAIAFENDYVPAIITQERLDEILGEAHQKGENIKEVREWGEKQLSGRIFFGEYANRNGKHISNLWISKCFSCDRICIWVHQKLVYPVYKSTVQPNDDLPEAIKSDFLEANAILDTSPRGAAALLRLCIQKLCAHLGKPGKDINADIGSLVKDGLDSRIQKSLDIVRVIGNSAVHPGQIYIKDDRETALALFGLINLIAEKTISEPKHVDDFYSTLPKEKLEQIKRRDS